jgi:hypothetical protein
MILTFYKPKRGLKAAVVAPNGTPGNPAETLSEVFDSCLANGASSFTREALFNRLIVELWRRRALGCLSLGREEFSKGLEQRGWIYDTKTHEWSKGGKNGTALAELALLGS